MSSSSSSSSSSSPSILFDNGNDSHRRSVVIPDEVGVNAQLTEQDLVVSRLKERVEKLERSLRMTQMMYSQSLTDLFSSIPAKASAIESGSIQQPFMPHAKLEVNFGKRFSEAPKVSAWVVIKDSSTLHSRSSVPQQPQQNSQKPLSGAANNAENFFNIEDELGTEFLKIHPMYINVSSINDSKRAIFTIPGEVELAAGTQERKQTATLYWIAWTPQRVNPKITTCIQKIFSSPGVFPRSVPKSKLSPPPLSHCYDIHFFCCCFALLCLLLFFR